MNQHIFQSRWFALLALLGAAASGFLWYINGDLGWAPLLIGGVPVVLLYLFRHENPVPNLVTALFSVFLLTAAVGVWAAYDPAAALAKFWVLLGSLLVFYALAAQPYENLPAVFWSLGLIGLGIAGYFLLSYNWAEYPADVEILNQLGLAWAGLRPTLELISPGANTAGGILAVLAFFTAAFGLRAARQRRALPLLLALVILSVQLFALLLTSSRAAWAALAAGAALWVWWQVSQRLKRSRTGTPARFFQRSLLIIAVAAIFVVMLFPTQIFALARSIPGEGSAISRAGLYVNAAKLVPVFWLTGGGLQSFAGLYSQYILGIPFLYFEYGHNLYLDVTLEQGIFGLTAMLGVFVFSFFWVLRGFVGLERRSRTRQIFVPAVFSALVAMLVHGLLDDPFYGEAATPLLFILPGLAIAVRNSRRLNEPQTFSLLGLLRQIPGTRFWASGLVVLCIGLLLTFYQPLAAGLLTNYSAVEMARIELADFPREAWVDLPLADSLAPVEPHLQQSLWYNPSQRGANYRMGLIQMYRRDFERAVDYLSVAYETDPDHRGVRKMLGFAYVWLGKYEQAYEKLSVLPEAERETNDYVSWWQQQGRPDLAQKAQRMAQILAAGDNQ